MPTEPWTGRAACALQRALRLSNERFAEHLDTGVRTVAAWHQNPDIKPKSDIQQLLDTAYERAAESVRKRFTDEIGDDQSAASEVDHSAREAAELRLTEDPNISAALEWLDGHAGWDAGTSRRKVAERLTILDVRRLRDRGTRRGSVTHTDIAHGLLGYYEPLADG